MTNALRIDILIYRPCEVMTQGAWRHWHAKDPKKEKEYRVLWIIKEQPLAVRKVVEQHCSYHSCNDNK